jgi:glyoxylase-like metal-dependent hydrolase (beta-lactamase superfamily II)
MTLIRHAVVAVILSFAAVQAASSAADLELWRLDCGSFEIEDLAYFSDAHLYDGRSARLSNGCYLVRNGDRYLLWDAGLPHEDLGNQAIEDGWLSSLRVTIADQLRELGLTPGDIDFVGVSHFHGDHVGQAGDFSHATLLMSRADVEWLRGRPPGNARQKLAAWFDGGAPLSAHAGDHDVFGDGTAVILALPGHTPGHGGLLIRLPGAGPVLLSGDLFHFRSEIGKRVVSRWNTSRADTLASIERFEAIAGALDPLVIVQHEAADVSRLPAFPASLR